MKPLSWEKAPGCEGRRIPVEGEVAYERKSPAREKDVLLFQTEICTHPPEKL